MKPKISILGCGWLGLDLAKLLVNSGYDVKGSTTTKAKLKQLQENAIRPFHIELTEDGITGNFTAFLSECDILILAIPPGLRKNPNKSHVKEMQHVVKALQRSTVKKLVYVSSTSVFKDDFHFPIISEKTAPNSTNNSAQQLIEIEQLLSSIPQIKTTIIRFSGLVGEDRHPGYYLRGRKNISNPEAPINLIHKTDCIAIISQIINQNIWDEAFNASYPNHPERKTYYTEFCNTRQLPVPSFSMSQKSKGKIIDSSYLVQTLSYSFNKAP
ncbi:NAD(P)H-binding protein [Winogradskyella sp. DF17]|uniref:NAD(P)H-binding protein n=1 Tax=Winogradskyella pelagia TaxID=2819984 RepID=A0ABS3SXC6_9FLAO|nr:NAD(P)H-binding protein [Winogradskyella sp. DF17]MBO3115124.1 NAD(P)H-binding protein [Winogradskyella sp. DF17]